MIQTAFPGDVILTGGLLRSIRAVWPDLPLAVVVRPDTVGLARMSIPDLEVVSFEKRGSHAGRGGLGRLAGDLRVGGWDTALLPHRSLRSALLARRAGCTRLVGYGIGGGAARYTDRVPYRRGVHEIERLHDLLAALQARLAAGDPGAAGEPPPLLPPRVTVPGAGWEELGALLPETVGLLRPDGPAVLAPGSVWPTKRWPEAGWIALARRLAGADLPIVWIGGPGEGPLCASLAERAGTGTVAAGRLNWEGTAALLSRARVLVANDSAPVHLAGAVGCPVVALFGPTVPGFGFGPLGRGSVSLGMRLGCRPCRWHGSRTCPEGHFRCLRDLPPSRVADAVARTIAGAAERSVEDPVISGTEPPSRG